MFEEISVLLVDDEELNIDLMQEYCEGNNIQSLIAHDGLEALQVLQDNERIDVIVLDRMMPNMNGIEFLEKVKADEKYKNIPVIMQTAATASHQIAEGISSGVFYYLPKPYSGKKSGCFTVKPVASTIAPISCSTISSAWSNLIAFVGQTISQTLHFPFI